MKTLKSFLFATVLLSFFAACDAEVVSLEESITVAPDEKTYTALWYNESGAVLTYLDQLDIGAAELAKFKLDLPALGLALNPGIHSQLIRELFGQEAITAIGTRTGDGFVIRPQLPLDLLEVTAAVKPGRSTDSGSCLETYDKTYLGYAEISIAEYCYASNAYFEKAGQCAGTSIVPGWCIILDSRVASLGCSFSCVAS